MRRTRSFQGNANNRENNTNRLKGEGAIFKATIEIALPKEEREIFHKSLLPDMHSTPRAQVDLRDNKGVLTITIIAKDPTALRASFNTITRLLGVVNDAKEEDAV